MDTNKRFSKYRFIDSKYKNHTYLVIEYIFKKLKENNFKYTCNRNDIKDDLDIPISTIAYALKYAVDHKMFKRQQIGFKNKKIVFTLHRESNIKSNTNFYINDNIFIHTKYIYVDIKVHTYSIVFKKLMKFSNIQYPTGMDTIDLKSVYINIINKLRFPSHLLKNNNGLAYAFIKDPIRAIETSLCMLLNYRYNPKSMSRKYMYKTIVGSIKYNKEEYTKKIITRLKGYLNNFIKYARQIEDSIDRFYELIKSTNVSNKTKFNNIIYDNIDIDTYVSFKDTEFDDFDIEYERKKALDLLNLCPLDA